MGFGCNLEGAGEAPPRGQIYYPTGIVVSPDQRYLVVVNSNFDRRYQSGSMQTYDLSALKTAIDQRCADAEASVDCELEPTEYLKSEVLISSLARTATLSSDGTRIYVPTHADASLAYVDISRAGKLSCGGRRTCSESFKRTGLASDPVAIRSIAATDLGSSADGEVIVVGHRQGTLTFLVHENAEGGAPRVVQVFSGLGQNLTGLDFDRDSGLLHVTSETSNVSGNKLLQRVGIDVLDDLSETYAFTAGSTLLRGIISGQDTWAVNFAGAGNDHDALVVTQRPDALLQVSFDASGTFADVRNLVEVGGGASRLAVTTITGPEGPRALAVIACYSERRVFVVDIESGDVVSIVPGFSGPFELAVDSSRALAFVTDFRSSTVRILDLSPILERRSARIVATLGNPQYLEELQ